MKAPITVRRLTVRPKHSSMLTFEGSGTVWDRSPLAQLGNSVVRAEISLGKLLNDGLSETFEDELGRTFLFSLRTSEVLSKLRRCAEQISSRSKRNLIFSGERLQKLLHNIGNAEDLGLELQDGALHLSPTSALRLLSQVALLRFEHQHQLEVERSKNLLRTIGTTLQQRFEYGNVARASVNAALLKGLDSDTGVIPLSRRQNKPETTPPTAPPDNTELVNDPKVLAETVISGGELATPQSVQNPVLIGTQISFDREPGSEVHRGWRANIDFNKRCVEDLETTLVVGACPALDVRQDFLSTLQEAQAASEREVAEERSLYAELAELSTDLLGHYILPLREGLITGIYKDIGDRVSAGEPVCRVEDPRELLLVAAINCKSPIRIGQEIQLNIRLFESDDELSRFTKVVAVRGHEADDDEWDLLLELRNVREDEEMVDLRSYAEIATSPMSAVDGHYLLPLNYQLDVTNCKMFWKD